MPRTVPVGLKKVTLSKKKTLELGELRQKWDAGTVNEMMSLAYEDWKVVTGSDAGFVGYQVYVLATSGLLYTDQTHAMESLKVIGIIDEFFKNVPEDTVTGLLANDLKESIVAGEAVRVYGE